MDKPETATLLFAWFTMFVGMAGGGMIGEVIAGRRGTGWLMIVGMAVGIVAAFVPFSMAVEKSPWWHVCLACGVIWVVSSICSSVWVKRFEDELPK